MSMLDKIVVGAENDAPPRSAPPGEESAAFLAGAAHTPWRPTGRRSLRYMIAGHVLQEAAESPRRWSDAALSGSCGDSAPNPEVHDGA